MNDGIRISLRDVLAVDGFDFLLGLGCEFCLRAGIGEIIADTAIFIFEVQHERKVIHIARKLAMAEARHAINQDDFFAVMGIACEPVRQFRRLADDMDIGIAVFLIPQVFQGTVNAGHLEFPAVGAVTGFAFGLDDSSRHEFLERIAEQVNLAGLTGQFEDVTVLGLQPYENLTNCTAAPYATYLLSREANAEEIATAYELVRFSEDQFVYWDMPIGKDGYKKDSTPCVFEQYKYAMPVDNSSCNVANAMLSIYELTGDELMKAKAKALIDNITVTQCVNTGKILTTWRVRHNTKPSFWINCSYSSACTLLRMEELTK